MVKSVEQLIEALGGATATAVIAGVGISAVSNWKTRGRVPAEYSLILSERCVEPVDPGVFGIKAVAEEARA